MSAPNPSQWANLITEQRNPASAQIDAISTRDALQIINDQDKTVANAIEAELDHIAHATDMVYNALKKGGRLFYIGAGTSGRLGVLDASECPPTYGVSPEMVQGIIAGGLPALTRSQEGAEDLLEDGVQALIDRNCTKQDVVMGIAASGVTPFVIGALQHAKSIGAKTIFFSCNPQAAKKVFAHVHITPKVGPEVITGSTRMKAGTATKMVLNMITTTTMIKLGKVYENLMVDLTPSCQKLIDRSQRILCAITNLSPQDSAQKLQEAQGNLKVAILMTKRAVSYETARQLLDKHQGNVRNALENAV
jgi:N-acetylmuramic acid 6-phosphate etherase